MAVVGLMVTSSGFAEFELITPEEPIESNSSITHTFWRAGVEPNGKYDLVGLHRYQGRQNDGIVLLYLPGTNMNGELAVTDEDHNIWLFLAGRGVKVYSLDYRTHAIPNLDMSDFSFMKGWGIEEFSNDVLLAFDQVREIEKDAPVFISGFSRGVSYAYILAGQRETAGLIALDGGFKSYRPTGFDIGDALKRLDKSGEYVTVLSRTRGWEGRQFLMQQAWQDPEGPAMSSRYESIGEQLTDTLYSAWGKGGLANPVDGISSITVLARMMENYDRFYPAIQNVQGRSLSSQKNDPSTTLDDHFGEMKIPILYFGATNLGGDSLMSGIYSATKSGSGDVTINVLENHGHVDVLVGNQVRSLVYEVALRWMQERSFIEEVEE